MISLSADVGGTFTDVILVDSDRSLHYADKVLTTPGTTSAIVAGIQRLCQRAGIAPSDIDVFIHGFTIATNAWLTRSGARVALAVTSGFRDVLEIATQRRPKTYDLHLRALVPLAERACVVEVDERVDAFGGVVKALGRDAARELAQRIAALKPEAVAISLLFSYLNDEHERLLADAVREALPSVPVYCSAAVNPQIEEYPRTNTTVTAAYVGPAVDRYIRDLETSLPAIGMRAPVLLMRSDGGVASIAAARTNPSAMLLSGPAGGVIAGMQISKAEGAPHLVTFDMGGTSADFSLIAEGQARTVHEREVHGERLRSPSLDIETISAGGGSIGSIDLGGALKVGPASAGAVPGPACYGRGGTQPTLTDAALVLGLLDADEYVDGTMSLDLKAAEEAIGTVLARKLGISVADAAYAMVAIANAQMAQAIRGLSVERGHDLREFALLSFGGAGSIFAPFLARDLGMKEVLVPLQPGVFSASGLLLTDIRHTFQAPFQKPLDAVDPALVRQRFDRLLESARSALDRDSVQERDRAFEYQLDMRFLGQAHDLTVQLPGAVEEGGWNADAIAASFVAQHARTYGFADATMACEIVSLRLIAIGRMPKPAMAVSVPARPAASRPTRRRKVYLGPDTGYVDALVVRRSDLAADELLHGPLAIHQPDTTIFVLPGQSVEVTRSGPLRIRSH